VKGDAGRIDVLDVPPIGHDEAMRIGAGEASKFGLLLKGLQPSDAALPTDCDRWNVADVVAHVVGSAAAQASPREFVRQVRAGKPRRIEMGSPHWWDGMNEVQVLERRGRDLDRLATEWSEVSGRALRARARLPRPIAGLRVLKLPAPIGRQPIRYLFDMGFTRDVWMHRIDIEHARGADPDLDATHDGRIVADIVAEWARSHGRPFILRLRGPAGGTFTAGRGGEDVEIDVVGFTRCLTERRAGSGVLAHPLPL
jgi:uncharacterized protein (TIGR03083 family)